MRIALTASAFALLLSHAALAAPYKCTGPDGRVTFQDQPCQSGAKGEKLNIRTPAPVPSDAAGSSDGSAAQRRREAELVMQRQRANDEIRARNEEVEARNRIVRCNNARRNLGILKEQRPVYQYNNSGEKQYLDDASRQAEVAAAQRAVAEHCN